MKNLVVAFVAASMLTSPLIADPALASEGINAAGERVTGCRVSPKPKMSDAETITAVFCIAVIEGMIWVSPHVCPPPGAKFPQAAIRIVVQYIDARPALHRENFKTIAHEALKAAWPCR